MAYVVLAHNTNEDGWESSYVFNTVFKSVESARAAILEDASYMTDEAEDNGLSWVDEDMRAFAYHGTILYQIEKMEMEQ